MRNRITRTKDFCLVASVCIESAKKSISAKVVNGRLNFATSRDLVRKSILAKVVNGRPSSATISKVVNGRLSSFTNTKEHHTWNCARFAGHTTTQNKIAYPDQQMLSGRVRLHQEHEEIPLRHPGQELGSQAQCRQAHDHEHQRLAPT
jgi:hypothetical protein